MKKFLALFCLFTLLTAFTCENEPLDEDIDTSFENTDEDLLGVWSLVDFTTELNTSTSFMGQVIESDINMQSTTADYDVEFFEDTFSTNGSYSYDTSGTLNGITLPSEVYTLDNVSGSGNYSVSGDEMTVDGSFFEIEFEGDIDTSAFEGEQTATYDISADGQTLTFSQDETTTETDDISGIVITISNISTSTWSKN